MLSLPDSAVKTIRGSVFGDPDRALAIARRLEVGQVYVNGAPFTPLAPFGGYKQSRVNGDIELGLGRGMSAPAPGPRPSARRSGAESRHVTGRSVRFSGPQVASSRATS